MLKQIVLSLVCLEDVVCNITLHYITPQNGHSVVKAQKS